MKSSEFDYFVKLLTIWMPKIKRISLGKAISAI